MEENYNYQQNQQNNSWSQDQQMVPTVIEPPHNHTLYLMLSILEIFFCGILWGVIGLCLSISGKKDFDAGRYAESDKEYRTAKIFLIIGLALNICIVAGSIIFFSYVFAGVGPAISF